MTRNIKLDRRGFLIIGGIAAASIEAAAQSAMRIGRAYLRVHPEEASTAVLLAAVAGRPLLARALTAAPDAAAVFRIMDELVRADFAAGEIVNCGGWILAKSEARACALFALRAARVG